MVALIVATSSFTSPSNAINANGVCQKKIYHQERAMDIPRGVSIALPFPTSQFHQATFRRLPRDHLHTPPQSDRTAASMAIPGARMEEIPPALPPPRHIYGLDDGIDLAWQYQNEEISCEPRKLAPIKSGSSLFGNSTQIPQLIKDAAEDTEMDMDLDLDDDNAQSIHSSAQSPSLSHSTRGMSIPALNRRPSAGINQSLPGEIPLAQQNHNRSNHAYDQHLLLKIGKSNSPPGHAKTAPFDHLRLGQKLSIQTRTPNLLGRPAQDTTVPADPNTKWLPSPTSAVSLSPRHSWREHSMAPRSPAESMSNSFSLDSEAADAAQARKVFQARVPTSNHFIEDTRTRSERGSYDSTMHTDVDSPADEAGSCSNVIAERPRPLAHHGTKRRAVSPPLGTSHGPKQEPPQLQRLHSSIPPQQSSYRASSLSSTASSINYPSYASSTMLSHASSMTSIATPDIPHSRESRHLFASPQSAEPPGTAALPLRKAPDPAGPPQAPVPGTSAVVQTQTRPARIGNHIICACCLKKPKKFETEEQLRAHENEKQYSCAYCNNRFKNKNEAERHQNSLHVRKQSWSCAAVSTYQAAFHPSSLSNPRNLATDTCGFCGDEFPNQPPNWEERVDHLTNVHKFGECNTTKKFYRADHFRQHLKHSHAGKSGKWTNILENSCQRDEASEITSQSPTASELSTSGSTSRLQGGILGNPTDASLSGVETIDGVQGES